jgi:hypothetical protein
MEPVPLTSSQAAAAFNPCCRLEQSFLSSYIIFKVMHEIFLTVDKNNTNQFALSFARRYCELLI